MASLTSNNLLPRNGEMYLYNDVFSIEQCHTLFELLNKSIEWKQENIKIFGKWVMQPRLSAWYGDEDMQYSYSGITLKPKIWISPLLKIKNTIEAFTNDKFNSCLLNLYRNGQDSMGWHRDNEKELRAKPTIGSVSFGATRIFRLQHMKDKKLKLDVELLSGSYLIMRGDTQHYWRHCVPKQSKCKDARLNITFRRIHK